MVGYECIPLLIHPVSNVIQTEPPGGGEVGRTSGLTPLKAAFGGQLTPQGVGTHGVEAFGRSGTHKGGWGLTLSRSGTHKGVAGIMYI